MSLQELDDYVRKLPLEIKESIRRYTGTANQEINSSLRRGFQPSSEIKTLRNIEKAFNEVPYLNDTLVVYRGVSKTHYILGDKAYISTSLDKETALEFAKCCLVIITLNPGCLVLPIKSISESGHEEEVLIDRGHRYELTRKIVEEDLEIHYLSCLPKETIEVEKDMKVADIDKLLERAESYLRETYDPDIDDLRLLYKEYRDRTGKILPKDLPERFLSISK